MINLPNPIPFHEIEAAAGRIKKSVFRTPLVLLESDFPFEVYLKLETQQPIGSFKLRGAGNAIESTDPDELLLHGVYTASAGNMAQGIAWYAQKLGIECKVVVPDHAPRAKLEAIERLGASYVKVPFDRWWKILINRKYEEYDGLFIHPVSDLKVMAGNGTIGLEIMEDQPDIDTIIVPFGGGGLSCVIASAVKEINPEVKVFASEVETACPLAASIKAGKPVPVTYIPSFVDGIGSSELLPEMWPLASSLLDGSLVVSLTQIAESIRYIYKHTQTIAEGAGASSLAAIDQLENAKKVVCVVSGGNIDKAKLQIILSGGLP
ncbi:MAG: threonine/serine dehydratase [Bacteroidetes bacterium]|nr:threonine/serine dehydratase [Bacteroidota bacterium]